MKRLIRLTVIAFPVLLTGCYTTNLLELDALKPSEITIPASVRSLTVVSRFDLDSTLKESSETAGMISVFIRDSILAKQVVLGCSDALVESPRFNLFNPLIRRNLTGEFSDAQNNLPWETIRIIAGDPPTDGVLSLETAAVNDTLKYSMQDGWQTFQYTLFVHTFWRLYHPRELKAMEFIFTDTMAFEIDSPSEFASSPDQRLECIRNGMYEAGIQTARRLAPWWTNFQRYYFAFGPMDYLGGTEMLKSGNWREAAENWRPYTKSKQNPVAARACFNMSLTCEIANNIPAALEWLKQSEKLGLHEFYISDYRAKLTKRKTETEKLDEQMTQ